MDQTSSGALSPKATAQDEAWRCYVDGLQRGPLPAFEEQLSFFRQNYAGRPGDDGPPRVWSPGDRERRGSNLSALMREQDIGSYAELHGWSVANREAFWEAVIRRLGIMLQLSPDLILDLEGGAENPRWLPGARMNIVDSCFRQHPDTPAIIQGREGTDDLEVLSYGELEILSRRFAAGLEARGLREGDGVALYMPMNLQCVAAYLGVVRAGLKVVSIPDSFPAPEVYRRVELGGARAVLTVEAFTRGGRTFNLYEQVRAAGVPGAVVIPAEDGSVANLRPGDVVWDDFLGAAGEGKDRPGDPDRVLNVLFSSGTTSTPKAIPWTQLTPIKCAMDGHLHQDIRPGDVVAWPTNIGWMMGPWLVFSSFINGATMALFEGAPMGAQFARFVQQAEVSMLGVVPSLVRAWRSSGALEQTDWTNVRVFSSTGEPSSQEDYLWLMSRARYRAPVIEYCGGTEIGGGHITGTVLQHASPATFTTAALGIDIVLLDEGDREAAVGEMGQLYLCPPALGLSQRLLNKDHHAEYYEGCPPGPRGQLLRRHGDQVLRLARGFYKAHGRADDAMNLGGVKVGSPEIEQVLDRHTEVYESAAVATQAEGGGPERLVVFVVPSGEPDVAELKRDLGRLLARELNPLFKIHDLVLVPELPRTASNKLMRRELRATYQRA